MFQLKEWYFQVHVQSTCFLRKTDILKNVFLQKNQYLISRFANLSFENNIQRVLIVLKDFLDLKQNQKLQKEKKIQNS